MRVCTDTSQGGCGSHMFAAQELASIAHRSESPPDVLVRCPLESTVVCTEASQTVDAWDETWHPDVLDAFYCTCTHCSTSCMHLQLILNLPAASVFTLQVHLSLENA